MRILLFNLGSIASRITSWDIDGFKSLLEQDVILWGPIPDERFLYGDREIPIIRIFEETSIKTVFNQFKDQWYPDIVVCDTSVLNYIYDIYLCPVKTILFARDAWADTLYNRGLVEFFDFINYGIVDRSVFERFNVNMLPLSNCAVSLPENNLEPLEFDKREIDVISISNYDSGFYHERYKTLFKLSEANESGFNIKYITGIKRKQINKYYQRSKIVLDWAHTLSNRSYEAALNGCLLFSHEDNPVIKNFWIPFEEYIPFNERNAMELLSFYLHNPAIAKKIVINAYNKVRNIPFSMGQSYWEQICIASDTEVDINERIRRISNMPASVLNYRLATPLVYNYNYNTSFPVNWKGIYFKRINLSLAETADNDSRIFSLIEAARLAFLLKDTDLTEYYLSELEKLIPEYAWIWYIRARQCIKHEELDEALEYSVRAIQCCTRAPELLKKYVLPLKEKNNSCDGRRITDYLWQAVYKHTNEFQVKSAIHLSLELKGDIFNKLGRINDATAAYREAVSNIPVPDCINKFFRGAVGSGNYHWILDFYEKGLDDSPYFSELVFYGAYALYRDGQKKKALCLLKKHRNSLKSFYGKRLPVFVRRSISCLLILEPFGKWVFVNILIYILEILRKRRSE